MCCLFVFTSLKHNQEKKNVFLFLWEEPLVLRILDNLVGGWGPPFQSQNFIGTS